MSRRSPPRPAPGTPRPAPGTLRSVSRTSHSRLGIVVAALFVFAASGIVSGQAGEDAPVAAAVAWPASTGLLISEVQTGGASASDEFVELYNAGPVAADLGGLELAYASSSGASATRKAAWSAPLLVAPGTHLLLANGAGAYASMADVTYSGGLASTGGAVVLRPTGGAPLDAVSWGDATNGFVEGAAAAAPPPGSSIERQPGGAGGNGTDTNVNRDDFTVRATPSPQGLAAPPVLPRPSATPVPTDTPTPTDQPTPTLVTPTPVTPAPATLTPDPSPGGTPPAASSTPEPPASEPPPTEPPSTEPPPTELPPSEPPSTDPPADPSPSSPPATEPPTTAPSPQPSEPPPATPSPDPTPTPIAEPSPSAPSPSPTATTQPEAMPIAAARGLADGALVTVAGSLTTAPGFVESGHETFVQDGTAGIALHLEGTDWPFLARGQGVLASGVLDTRYGQRVLRVARPSDLIPAAAELPVPARLATGDVREPWEGSLVSVTARVTGSASSLTDGFAVEIDDGSGPIKVVAVAASGIQPPDLPRGAMVAITGVAGQRDSTGSGTAGYRLYPRDAADISRLPDPTPDPSGEPTPTAVPSPTPTPLPEPTPTPLPSSEPEPSGSPSPSPSGSPHPTVPDPTIAEARRLATGTTVRVTGTVTAERGRVVDLRTAVIQDGGAGIAVRLTADQSGLLLDRGLAVRVTGRIAERFGNLEIRLLAGSGLEVTGTAPVPTPRAITAPELGEATEGVLVRATGTVVEISRTGGTTTSFVLDDGHGKIRVSLPAAIRSEFAGLCRGQHVDVTGVAGQRAPRAGSPTGYAIWPRDAEDVIVTAAVAPPTGSPGPADPTPGPSGQPGGGATPPGATSPVTILRARQAVGTTVTIDGTVTTAPGLLDADGRRVIVEDATGGILVRLPAGSPTVGVGDRVRLRGKVGTFEHTPQVAASDAPVVVARVEPRSPRLLTRTPARADDCRLVRITGTVVSIRRYGQSWRAQVRLANRATVEVQGLVRSGIAADRLAKGVTVDVTGVVRLGQNSGGATVSAILPRDPADLKVGGSRGTGTAGSGGAPAGGSTGSPGTSGLVSAAIGDGLGADIAGASDPIVGASAPGSALAQDVELVDLARHTGEVVRAGGLVASVSGTGLVLDDGTASADVRVAAEEAAGLADIRQGDAVNVTGLVQAGNSGAAEIAVGPDGALVRLAGLAEARSSQVGDSTADIPSGAGSVSDTGAQTPASVVEVALEVQSVASPGPGESQPHFPSGLGILFLLAALAGGARLALRHGRARTPESERPIDVRPPARPLLDVARVVGMCLNRARRRSDA